MNYEEEFQRVKFIIQNRLNTFGKYKNKTVFYYELKEILENTNQIFYILPVKEYTINDSFKTYRYNVLQRYGFKDIDLNDFVKPLGVNLIDYESSKYITYKEVQNIELIESENETYCIDYPLYSLVVDFKDKLKVIHTMSLLAHCYFNNLDTSDLYL